MSDEIISLYQTSKRYRIFKSSRYRILDLLGFKVSLSHYDEFWALRDINLSIRRGSKIAIVGSNGAGKSTLLKIIAGQLKATEGEVHVQGKVSALMELGTGFHPEFSGWENILASLSYMGITGVKARKLADSIVEFTELEEFIHNPLKTYSAGMYARLAFSVATEISPEILIIDEILGAGDSYFSHKAYERMQSLTSGGTTVLFVSHDMSSVERLCDEAIWLERGKIRMRGDVMAVSKAYSDAVRKREQIRLDARNSMMQIGSMQLIQKNNRPIHLIIRLSAGNAPVHISYASILKQNQILSELYIGDAQDTSVESDAFVLMDNTVGVWSSPVKLDNKTWAREIQAQNSGAIVFSFDAIDMEKAINIKLKYSGGGAKVQCFDGDTYQDIFFLPSSASWEEAVLEIPGSLVEKYLSSVGVLPQIDSKQLNVSDDSEVSNITSTANEYELYTGHLEFKNVEFVDSSGNKKSIFKTFDSFNILIRVRVFRDIYQPEFVACFHRSGLIAFQTLSRMVSSQTDYLQAEKEYMVTLSVPSLSLGRGNYFLSLGVFPPIDHHSLDTERSAYLLQDRRYEILVEQPEGGVIDLGISRSHCTWEVEEL